MIDFESPGPCFTPGRLFGDFKQNCAGLHVSDSESGEVNAVCVLLWTTKVIYGNKTKSNQVGMCPDTCSPQFRNWVCQAPK